MAFKKGEGGRKPGAKNKLTLARMQLRQEALRRLNEELPEDAFRGDAIELFQRVYRDPNFDPQLRLDAAAKIAQFERKETNPEAEPKHVVHMPTQLPGDTTEAQLAVWWALYGALPADEPAGNDPVLDDAVKVVLDRASKKKPPETLS